MRLDKRRAETIHAKHEAESRSIGDAYLRQWARWYRQDGAPSLKAPAMNYLAKPGFPDPPRVPLDEQTAAAIGNLILTLPPDEEDVVRGYYVRRRRIRVSNASWDEPLRYWKPEQLAKILDISERTMYRRLKSARSNIEAWAERDGLAPPP